MLQVTTHLVGGRTDPEFFACPFQLTVPLSSLTDCLARVALWSLFPVYILQLQDAAAVQIYRIY